MSRLSRQKLLALDDYKRIVNLLEIIITELNKVNDNSTFAANIEKYKNIFNQLLDVNKEPLSSLRRKFSSCLQNNYWMSAENAFSCFEDFIEDVTIYNVTDVYKMLALKSDELINQLIVPFSSKADGVEYKLQKRARLSKEVSEYLKGIQSSNFRAYPLSNKEVEDFYWDVMHFENLIKKYRLKMQKSIDKCVSINKLYEDRLDVYDSFFSSINEIIKLYEELMEEGFKLETFKDYIESIITIYEKCSDKIYKKIEKKEVKDEELDLQFLSGLLGKLNEEGEKYSSEAIKKYPKFPGPAELKRKIFKYIFEISNSYFLWLCSTKAKIKS